MSELSPNPFAALEDADAEHEPKGAPRSCGQPDGLPDGFRVQAGGVFRLEEPRGDESGSWVWLCSPLRVLALPRDKSGTGWGRLVEVTDPDGRAHRWAFLARLFAGDGAELRAGLLELGLQMASGAKAKAALGDLLMHWRPTARAVTADRLGRPGRVTVPTPSPAAKVISVPVPGSARAITRQPWVTSGSSPASLTTPASAQPSPAARCASAKRGVSPRGRAMVTASGKAPPQSRSSAPESAAVAQAPVVHPRRRVWGLSGRRVTAGP